MGDHHITVEDLSRVLGCTQTTVWRCLANPFKLPFRRKTTPNNQSGRVHHYRLSDVIQRLRAVRRGGLSNDECTVLVRLDFEQRNATRMGD